MFIVLPNDIHGLTTVENNLHKVKLGQCLQQAFPSDIELFLPKFKIETTLDLEQSLREVTYTLYCQKSIAIIIILFFF